MRIPDKFYRQIVDHARRGKPNEVCGLIAGRDSTVLKLYQTTNNDPLPRVRYNIEPLELLRVLREIEDNGWRLLAIYHSHPMTRAYPSATDIGLAYYPDAVYIIVSLADETPVVGAFKIVDGEIEEHDLVVEPEEETVSGTAQVG